MTEKIAKVSINNLEEEFVFGKVAKSANGSVLYRQKKAVILAAVTMEKKEVEEEFLPLTVQYIEKAYAAAKIPGGFIKRETKPGDFETLTARVIDRSIRPLFPKTFKYPVVVTAMVLSSDEEVDLQIAALHAVNAALSVSDLPVEKSIAGVRIGRVDDQLIVNPTRSEMERSSLDLLVTADSDDLIMIEMAVRATDRVDGIIATDIAPEMMIESLPMILSTQQSNEMPEEEFLDAVSLAVDAASSASRNFDASFKDIRPSKLKIEEHKSGLYDDVRDFIEGRYLQDIENALFTPAKKERGRKLSELFSKVIEDMFESSVEYDEAKAIAAYDSIKSEIVRKRALNDALRVDGRGPDDVRPIDIETNILPGVHGSCLFTRGETQVLVAATLGDAKDAQTYELLTDRGPKSEKFMLHYNFPGFSVGEARPIGAPGRRELGHGNLAKRAIEPTMEKDMDRTVRLVSEVLQSNGSSSMATVCGASLALCSAEIEVSSLVAGVAMGLIKENDRYVILTDILGIEDQSGDIDLKIAGTRNGITAMQMDIKIPGLDLDILKEALDRAREARMSILDKMQRAREGIVPSGALPVVEHFSVDPSKIVHIIGKAGATIRDIIERFGVSIDLDREKGGVKLTGKDAESVEAAKGHITRLARNGDTTSPPRYEVGKRYTGKVKKIVDFGVFVEMPGGYDALLHISKVSKGHTNNLQDLYTAGEEIDVVVLEQKGRKVELATPQYLE